MTIASQIEKAFEEFRQSIESMAWNIVRSVSHDLENRLSGVKGPNKSSKAPKSTSTRPTTTVLKVKMPSTRIPVSDAKCRRMVDLLNQHTHYWRRRDSKHTYDFIKPGPETDQGTYTLIMRDIDANKTITVSMNSLLSRWKPVDKKKEA